MNQNIAIRTMIFLLVLIIVFHFTIILKIVPYEITWGGRLENDAQMYVFESVSIFINLILLSILLIKGKFIKEFVPMKFVNVSLWIFFFLFILNTIGNIMAKTNFEKFFTLFTLAFSILIWITLRKSKDKE